jgi:hypothetical protein
MAASGHGLWVRVGESDSAGGPAGRTVLERFDGRSWTTLSAAPVPSPVNWSIAEINAGQGYGGYLLCGFRLSAAQRAAFYGFGWTCPPGLAVTALAPVPGATSCGQRARSARALPCARPSPGSASPAPFGWRRPRSAA